MNQAHHESSQPKERLGARVRRFLGSMVLGGVMGPRDRHEQQDDFNRRATQQLRAIDAIAASMPADHRSARVSGGVFSRTGGNFQAPTGEATASSGVTLGSEKPVPGSNMGSVDDMPALRSPAALRQRSQGAHEMPAWAVGPISNEVGGWVPGEREARPGVIDPSNPLSPGGNPGVHDPHHK